MHDIQAVLKVLAVAVGFALLIACVKAATMVEEASRSIDDVEPVEDGEISLISPLSEQETPSYNRDDTDLSKQLDSVDSASDIQQNVKIEERPADASSDVDTTAREPVAQIPAHSSVEERVSSQHWPEIAGTLSGRRALGYYAEDFPGDTASLVSLQQHSHLIDYTAAFSFQIDERGQLTAHRPAALETDIPVLALVHNFHNGWFDRAVAVTLLKNQENRQLAIANIVSEAVRQGYAGIHIDLENFGYDCREEFTLFMQELKSECDEKGLGVSIAVPAKTYDSRNQWSGGFDYCALAPHVDFMVLMTYDQHWFGGTPGPIAAVNWVEDVVRYAVGQVPRDKLYLGIAGYGYDWGSNGQTRAYSMKAVEALAAKRGIAVEWHDEFRVPFLYYQEDNGIKHQLWFENEVSLLYKLKLVEKYDLAGIALWRLGFANEEFWKVIERAR